VTSGFNADFDGDAMSAYVPVSAEAVKEAFNMLPSRNLFSPSTGGVMYAPTHEMKLGLYGITSVGDKTSHSFKNYAELEGALNKGVINHNHQVTVGGLKSTAGRFVVAGALPEGMRKDFLSRKEALDSAGQSELLTTLARNHINDYGTTVNKLKDLGNQWATSTAFTLGMEDVKPEKAARQKIIAEAQRAVAMVKDPRARDDKAIDVYAKATTDLNAQLKAGASGDRLGTLLKVGLKGGYDTVRQIKMAPMLIANAKGEIIPSPITKSYSEGLDLADYWTSTSGARKGIIQKVQQVQQPGYITKQVMNSIMNNLIIDHDCGTDRGIALPIEEKDILDRFMAVDHKAGRTTFKAGTLITPEVRTALRNNKIGRVVVRSPLRCMHGPGVCQKCHGLDENGKVPPLGTNVGVMAGQAIGERAAQLTLKAFHTGGTAASMENIVEGFDHVEQLLRMPMTLPGSATLSTISGKVEKIEQDPAGGHNVFIGGVRHFVPHARGVPIYNDQPLKKGMEIKKGAPISRGPINVHEMLPLTGVEAVQGHLADELHNFFKSQGIRRRNHEIIAKAMTNLTKIEHPGDHHGFLPGDYAPTAMIANLNRTAPKNIKPIVHRPVLHGVNVLPLEMQEDWVAKLNHERLATTVIEAAQQGWISKLHGEHPIPAVVHGAEIGKGKKPWEY
jgi:DNA-directed RNA polymerase subunit beta'